MFETGDSIHNCDSEEDQPSPSYEEEWLRSEDYRIGFENAIMQVREKYELRSKKNLDTPKPKAPRLPSKKYLRKILKQLLKVTNMQLRVLGRTKKRTTKTLIHKVNQLAALALQLVLLIKLSQDRKSTRLNSSHLRIFLRPFLNGNLKSFGFGSV